MTGRATYGRNGVAAALACAATLTVWVAPAQTPALVARASDVTGRALISTGNGMPAFALTRGYALSPGDRVDTRGGGRVVIDLSDGSMVVVHPETVLTLKDYRAAASLRELFEITMGLVRVKINHFAGRPNPYRMNSPTASVAVRGTEFTVAVEEGGETQVEVYEGAVEVSSLARPEIHVLLEAGRGVLVRPGQDFQLYVGPSGRGMAMRPGNDDRGQAVRAEIRQAGVPLPPPAGPGTATAVVIAPGTATGPTTGTATVQPGTKTSPAPLQVPLPQPAATMPAPAPQTPAEPFPRTPDPGLRDPRLVASGSWNGLPGAPPDPRTPWPRETSHGLLPANKDYTDGRDFVVGGDSHSISSAYDQYLANLGDVNQLPFLYRFTAFPEAHLDSLENPAYATVFRQDQGRFMLLPSRSGFGAAARENGALAPATTAPAEYGVSPQMSAFTPVLGQKLVVGVAFSAAQTGSSADILSSTSKFLKQTVVAASKFGRHSFGLSFDRLQGDGVVNAEFTLPTLPSLNFYTDSRVEQRRVTAGYTLDIARRHKLGAFVRYGGIEASDLERPALWGEREISDGTRTSGHSLEAGIRLRGLLLPRLSYGLSAQWMGLSLGDGLTKGIELARQRERMHRESIGLGFGFLLTRRTLLSLDVAAGQSRMHTLLSGGRDFGISTSGTLDNRFVSTHVALQRDITRKLFASASYLQAFRSNASTAASSAALFSLLANPYSTGNRFSDIGAGWRFTPNLTAQYVYSTSYGTSSAAHALLLRYTFRLKRE